MTTALVSGGKDSIASAQLADEQGWPVDELLVLVPQDPDSFLFHTPNLELVEHQAEAWGKVARSVPIDGAGEAVESEALRRALRTGTGPIVTGAIASSYQWGRLQRLSFELGRPLFAPLWGKDPGRVVRAEIASGLDIRLVQVAAEGLGEELLGRRLDLTLLEQIEAAGRPTRWVHAAGEGGEYETLVVDAPFFRSRLVLEETELERRGLAARLVVRRCRLAPKELGPPRSDGRQAP
ncbi:MAG TPA: diphthine--ammonia ligase [Thermoplasmata archaeon]|nr:diphthine--ammonia ligase [Thermoplasmata archaeon]